MPSQKQFEDAINWALQQENDRGEQVTKNNHHELSEKVAEYFDNNNIEYPNFSYDDFKDYLPQ